MPHGLMSRAKQSSGLTSRIDRRFATRLVRREIWPCGYSSTGCGCSSMLKEQNWSQTVPPCGNGRHCCSCMAVPASTTRLGLGGCCADHLSRSSRQWSKRGWPSSGLEPGAVGRACVLRRLGHREPNRPRRVIWRHGCAGLRDAPSGPPLQAGADQHRSRRRHTSGPARGPVRTLLAARKSAPWRAAGSLRLGVTRTRPRSTPGSGWPFRSIRGPRAIRTWHAARSSGQKCCVGSQNRTAKATRSIRFPILDASSARPSCSVAKMIRYTRSRARPISQRRCRRILCNSNGLPNCRHAVVPDAPERAMAVIRDFIGRK
jgi:hypothetical protein